MGVTLDFSVVVERWPMFLDGAWLTIRLALASTVLGFALGTLCAIGRRGRSARRTGGGVARGCGNLGIMPATQSWRMPVALDFNRLSPEELLAAESAVLTMRSLMEAAKLAPHGHGMARVESALN